MNRKNIWYCCTLLSLLCTSLLGADQSLEKSDGKKMIKIILGSTRQQRSSDKIATSLLEILSSRTDTTFEILDLRDYALPFLYEPVAPMMRKEITDPVIQKWSDAVASADGYIIISPEYNSGYPGVLKNALDLLYKEWNNKPVAFVGYSGGPNGGKSAIMQLRQVAKAFQMIPVSAELLIPSSRQAFDSAGKLKDASLEKTVHGMVDQLIEQYK